MWTNLSAVCPLLRAMCFCWSIVNRNWTCAFRKLSNWHTLCSRNIFQTQFHSANHCLSSFSHQAAGTTNGHTITNTHCKKKKDIPPWHSHCWPNACMVYCHHRSWCKRRFRSVRLRRASDDCNTKYRPAIEQREWRKKKKCAQLIAM